MEEIFKYLGDADLNIGLHVLAPKPLDDRSVVKRTSQLYKIPENRAYEGMTVANLENNNIYMLIDKNKIGYREGWKASYESIQIVSCTYEQYKIWEENTNDDFTPKDEALEFLHEDTYYYIYEDSLPKDIVDQEYVKASLFKELQDIISTKANTTSLQPIRENITNIQDNIENLQNELNSYYTKTETDETFVKSFDLTTTLNNYVTISMLGGEEGQDGDYMFLTKTEWNKYISETLANEFDTININLNSKATLEDDVEFNSVKTDLIGNDDSVIQFTENGVSVGKKDEEIFPIALQKDIPVIEVMEQEEYDNIEKNEDHFYFIYKKDGMGFVSVEVFNQLVATVNGLQLTIGRLNQRITDLENRLTEESPEQP